MPKDRYRTEPAGGLTPEQLFERRWTLALLQQVMARLREEFEAKGKGPLFDRLRDFLVGEKGTGYAQAAEELGLSEGAVKVAVHRLRQRYRELLREEIGRTVATPEEVDEEIRSLFAALGAVERLRGRVTFLASCFFLLWVLPANPERPFPWTQPFRVSFSSLAWRACSAQRRWPA